MLTMPGPVEVLITNLPILLEDPRAGPRMTPVGTPLAPPRQLITLVERTVIRCRVLLLHRLRELMLN